tara:strand:+ start:301 stop:912 length:612 start_codon:yes stop_codon:yes gene_type:complete
MSQPYTFYFRPQADGYTETYTTISDVFTSENGLSIKDTSRISLQARPLITVNMTVNAVTQNDAVRMQNIIRLAYQNEAVCYVPLWFSRDKLRSSATTASTSITIDEAYAGAGLLDGFSYTDSGSTVYRNIMINVGNYKYPSVHDVASISSGVVSMGTAPDMNYPANTEVVPLLYARISELTEGSGRRLNAYGWSYDLTFEEKE